jgi:serine/threonine-protein kinase
VGDDFLVTEYVRSDLDQLVQAHGPLLWPLAFACARQTALGLAHAHAHGLIHGEIQPGNLLVDATATWPVPAAPAVQLAGFGLAWLTAPANEPAPIRESLRADARADLYGLGSTLYYLLTGQVPCPRGRDGQAEPVVLRRVRPDVPPAAAALVHRLLARRPEERFQSADHVAAALGLFTEAARPARVLPSSAGVPAAGAPAPAASAGPLVRCLSGPADALTCIACATDGRLAAATRDRSVRIWELATARRSRARLRHSIASLLWGSLRMGRCAWPGRAAPACAAGMRAARP